MQYLEMYQQGDIILSRFFDNNAQLVAKMCHRCYEECEDVKILSVNLPFLKQVGNFEDVSTNTLVNVFKGIQWQRIAQLTQDDFFGFSEETIEAAKKSMEQFKNVVEAQVNDMEQLETSSDINNNIREELPKQFLVSAKSVNYKTRKKLSLDVVKNLCTSTKRNAHKKSSRRFAGKAQSQYFEIEESKYFIKLDQSGCGHIKTDPEPEMVDYESIYFDALKTERYLIKNEPKITLPKIWAPPRSPHNLIEEVLHHDPWALLVATIFLNRTSCMCARPYVFWFLTQNPDPFKVLDKHPEDLEKYFVKLGLQKTRAVQVWRMSHDFVYKKWRDVKDLYGIGAYGEAAYRMFCQGDFSVAPKDRFLRIYQAWYQKILMKEEVKAERLSCYFNQ